ncbi:hypothetical protein [Tellurirhabdus bombi]|uniref:hypothetical protein n=1 Tax=Tellurirhabdus bombi TaxID=2907205 RepID=UPI001F388207|nr:hypothetical protein [Tellurirhabdus bombi]
MKNILVLSERKEKLVPEISQNLQLIYPNTQITVRRLKQSLLTELLALPTELLPRMILVEACAESLDLLRELKAHPYLYRIPVLMLQAKATQRRAQLDQEIQPEVVTKYTLGHTLN